MQKSARLGKYRQRRKRDHSDGKVIRRLGIIKFIAVALGIFFLAFAYIRINTKYWNGKDKVAFAFQSTFGDVGVTVVDPELGELTTLIIPGDTEVEVAESYGALRIKNVWQLSQNEKLKGRLLPETIMQNFLFPLHLWLGGVQETLDKGKIDSILRFVFTPGSTNIPFGDRLDIGLFALRAQSLGKTNINLAESQFLRKQLLNDGIPGYKLNGAPSERLTIYFSDNQMSKTSPKVYIIDETGEFGVADTFGKIVEVMGGKVVSVDKRAQADSDCEIKGLDKVIVKKVAAPFSCKEVSGKSDFDLEVKLGKSFAKRF